MSVSSTQRNVRAADAATRHDDEQRHQARGPE
jgi:hypothetical protein